MIVKLLERLSDEEFSFQVQEMKSLDILTEFLYQTQERYMNKTLLFYFGETKLNDSNLNMLSQEEANIIEFVVVDNSSECSQEYDECIIGLYSTSTHIFVHLYSKTMKVYKNEVNDNALECSVQTEMVKMESNDMYYVHENQIVSYNSKKKRDELIDGALDFYADQKNVVQANSHQIQLNNKVVHNLKEDEQVKNIQVRNDNVYWFDDTRLMELNLITDNKETYQFDNEILDYTIINDEIYVSTLKCIMYRIHKNRVSKVVLPNELRKARLIYKDQNKMVYSVHKRVYVQVNGKTTKIHEFHWQINGVIVFDGVIYVASNSQLFKKSL
ncbi:hypothetical protein ECANGB1_2088 [Enterospora canceri]|uniref:Uncharacterized protein n=1 Tax=Enterospora canceri TaxID=1081671 RepID=A0A1Y1S8S7_9MICR|nr:hypothetical protein ECANGB1_2088 [Enterospora canceri]